ncbi:MAG: NAD(P)-binding domain-containing protein, partial [Alphaproteobacteria bacterium]|nr:NAD(P)-binding domain-containing protein [Alphaproteobacteria bacterium]
MKIAIIGTGYVGLPTGVGLAELGHQVTCIDTDKHKIAALNAGKITLFEEGLEALMTKNIREGRLHFTTSKAEAIPSADVVMIAVGT